VFPPAWETSLGIPKGKARGCPARDESPLPHGRAGGTGYVGTRRVHAGGAAACRLSLTLRQMQEALTPGHLKKAKLMFFFTRYPSSSLLKTYFLDVQVKRQLPAPVPGRVPSPPCWGSCREGDALVSPHLAGGSGGMAPASAGAAPERVLRAMADPGCQVFALRSRGAGIREHHERASPRQGGWDPSLRRERHCRHPSVTVLAGASAPPGQGWVWGQASGAWLGWRGLTGREAPRRRNARPRALPPAVQPLHHLPAHQVVQQLPRVLLHPGGEVCPAGPAGGRRGRWHPPGLPGVGAVPRPQHAL